MTKLSMYTTCGPVDVVSAHGFAEALYHYHKKSIDESLKNAADAILLGIEETDAIEKVTIPSVQYSGLFGSSAIFDTYEETSATLQLTEYTLETFEGLDDFKKIFVKWIESLTGLEGPIATMEEAIETSAMIAMENFSQPTHAVFHGSMVICLGIDEIDFAFSKNSTKAKIAIYSLKPGSLKGYNYVKFLNTYNVQYVP